MMLEDDPRFKAELEQLAEWFADISRQLVEAMKDYEPPPFDVTMFAKGVGDAVRGIHTALDVIEILDGTHQRRQADLRFLMRLRHRRKARWN